MVQPNEHGVYPCEAAETIAWPRAKGHHICAEIRLLQVDGVWLEGCSLRLGGTDMRGVTSPLKKSARLPGYPDRLSALTACAQGLLRYIEGSDCKCAPSIRAWLGDLITGPVQADLFAEAA